MIQQTYHTIILHLMPLVISWFSNGIHGMTITTTTISLSPPMRCSYHRSGIVNSSVDDELPTNRVDEKNSIETCTQENPYCYALWKLDGNSSQYKILAQGCWDSSSSQECSKESCVFNKRPIQALDNTHFCCCSGQMCNTNATFSTVQDEEENFHNIAQLARQMARPSSPNASNKPSMSGQSLLTSLTCVILVLTCIFIFGGVICLRVYYATKMIGDAKKKRCKADSMHLLESQSSQTSSSNVFYDLDDLTLMEVIGKGRYGSVSRGILNGNVVAVKVFNPQHRSYYQNEKEIYQLPFMNDHEFLPRFIGSKEKLMSDGRLELQLVLAFAPLGCLQEYLTEHTVDWHTLCKMILSVTQALSHLHSEIRKGDKLKPCIAHRDLSSRNILVKADKSCMICDFGFGLRISGSKYYMDGSEQFAESSSLQDVGTLRYMAPEILEGAVNLRECESAMKQIDVYALGLVLWEVGSRCADLYQGVEVPAYKQPFEKEIGSHSTFEQMQVLVTKKKARPLFPCIWKDTNPAIRLLKETIEDCWDHDADARLTALCVQERVSELPILWDRYKNGSMNMNMTSHSIISNSNSNTCNKLQSQNLLSNFNSHININSIGFAPNIIGFANRGSGPDGCLDKVVNELHNHNQDDQHVTATINYESEKNVQQSTTNAFVNQTKLTLPLQPYHGRNPCLERNLLSETSDEDNTSTLLMQGLKFNVGFNNNNNNNFKVSNNNRTTSPESANATQHQEHNSQPTFYNQRRNPVPPIPYLQNAVGMNTLPKQPNVPGNANGNNRNVCDYNFLNGNVNSREGENNNMTSTTMSKLLKLTKLKHFPNFNTTRRSGEEVGNGSLQRQTDSQTQLQSQIVSQVEARLASPSQTTRVEHHGSCSTSNINANSNDLISLSRKNNICIANLMESSNTNHQPSTNTLDVQVIDSSHGSIDDRNSGEEEEQVDEGSQTCISISDQRLDLDCIQTVNQILEVTHLLSCDDSSDHASLSNCDVNSLKTHSKESEFC